MGWPGVMLVPGINSHIIQSGLEAILRKETLRHGQFSIYEVSEN